MLKKLINYLNKNYNLFPVIGIEVEFYLFSKNCDQTDENNIILTFEYEIEKYFKYLKYSQINKILFKKERGIDQYEIVLPLMELTSNINNIFEDYDKIISMIKNIAEVYNFFADFSPKPKLDDYGSSLQINISLHDKDRANLYDSLNNSDNNINFNTNLNYQKKYLLSNIFSYENITTNDILQQSIAGILRITDEIIPIICDYFPEQISRLKHSNASKFMAPCTSNWGVNNRYTAIRIPESNNLQRRIEYRLGGGEMSLYFLILVCISGVVLGLQNKILPLEQVYTIPKEEESKWDIIFNEFVNKNNTETFLFNKTKNDNINKAIMKLKSIINRYFF
ncbi:type I glutamate--ammonia ligase [Lyticum sinuosum]|uniref:Glutamine synthetase C-terminal domain protein n=1 Tax=Lyticum sinuosum TaxID=1332059 RepID=A0AAE5AHU2_9RICK|nr:hypothetical protein [Lyticum sinuosum]MDZ5761568.1 putative glutamine synthetase C-terminal domain protein [Lyticum sinuosum]